MLMRAVCCFVLLVAVDVAAQQTIFFKRDIIYVNGREIAIVTPAPTDQTAPTAPSGLAYSQLTATSVQLSWAGSTDSGGSSLAGYKVYRGLLPVGTVGPATLTFVDQPLRPSTNYSSYTIVAFDNAQNHSAASNSVAVTTPSASGDTTAPSTPANLQGYASAFNQVKLRWFTSTDTGGAGVHGYKVYRGGNLISGANPITTIEYTDTGVVAESVYSYTVRSIDNNGNTSPDSTAANVTTPSELLFEDEFTRLNCPAPTGTGMPSSSCIGGSWNATEFYLSAYWARCSNREANLDDDEELENVPCEGTVGVSPNANVRIVLETDGQGEIIFWGGYRAILGYYIQIRNSSNRLI